ncbi:hypothetical protein BC833DRAFT_624587 [Globomyces pollinis-pini]|nr:hypothetical protein BC833DRAFT_624587 [Globomyces pollinis-pini]
MKPDPHKAKATRQWQKKHGTVPSKERRNEIAPQQELPSDSDHDQEDENALKALLSQPQSDASMFMFKDEKASQLTHSNDNISHSLFSLDLVDLQKTLDSPNVLDYLRYLNEDLPTERMAMLPFTTIWPEQDVKDYDVDSEVIQDQPAVKSMPIIAKAKSNNTPKQENIDEWLDDILG